MRVTRIAEDDAGESRFEDLEVPLVPAGAIGDLSAPQPAAAVLFRETPGDYDFDWHRAPRRQLIVLLDGVIEIEVGSGERRTFRGGDLLLVEDVGGRGHRTRSLAPGVRRSLFVDLGDHPFAGLTRRPPAGAGRPPGSRS